jgi:hypothetical protein
MSYHIVTDVWKNCSVFTCGAGIRFAERYPCIYLLFSVQYALLYHVSVHCVAWKLVNWLSITNNKRGDGKRNELLGYKIDTKKIEALFIGLCLFYVRLYNINEKRT